MIKRASLNFRKVFFLNKKNQGIQIIQSLNSLANDSKNIVFAISKDSITEMNQLYKHNGPNIGLAAEEGFFFKTQNTSSWQEFD